MAKATATIGTANYLTRIESAGRTLNADEPEALGGKDAGFAPYDLLLASLGACTAITLRMYAERKQWPLEAAEVSLKSYKVDDKTIIDRKVNLTGDLTAEQRQRLLDICERTPVTKTLKEGASISTTLV